MKFVKQVIDYIIIMVILSSSTASILKTLNENDQNYCQSSIKIDEECASRFLYFGNRNSIITFDENLLEQSCNDYEDGLICLNNFFDKCLHGQVRLVANGLYSTATRQYENRCKNETTKMEFIKHSQCFHDKNILEKFHQCGDLYFYRIKQIRSIPERENQISAACCTMALLHSCLNENNRKLCNDYDDNGEFWSKIFDEFADEVGLFCYGFENENNCTQNLPDNIFYDYLQKPLENIDEKILRKRWKFLSLIMSTIDIAADFEL